MNKFVLFCFLCVQWGKLGLTSLVREVAVVLELCESYDCGWVAIRIATKILRFFRNDAQLVDFTPSHYEERELR